MTSLQHCNAISAWLLTYATCVTNTYKNPNPLASVLTHFQTALFQRLSWHEEKSTKAKLMHVLCLRSAREADRAAEILICYAKKIRADNGYDIWNFFCPFHHIAITSKSFSSLDEENCKFQSNFSSSVFNLYFSTLKKC